MQQGCAACEQERAIADHITPPGKKVDVLFKLEAINNYACPVAVHMNFICGDKTVKQEIISAPKGVQEIKLMHETAYKAAEMMEHALMFTLASPQGLSDVWATVSIKVRD